MKHGYWVKIEPYPLQVHDYECSECGHETDDPSEKYCSECGTKMELIPMKKVFISQPMKDLSISEILSERKRVVQKLYDMGYKPEEISVMDSLTAGNAPGNNNQALWFLSRSIGKMASADIAVFAKGWRNARGCRIEFTCAKEYGIEHVICEDEE